jgi:hypothetical protein
MPADNAPPPAEASRLRSGFFATLANPMDLQVAAELLSRGIEPDPFNLQHQQFKIVDSSYRELTGVPFPADRFATAVLKARIEERLEIDATEFPQETEVLLARKQAIARSSHGTTEQGITNYQFRHDKIKDFYTHFAFLGDDPSVRFAHVRDDRFAGVYDQLARALTPGQAEELHEYLLVSAVDTQDHRVSDRFIQHLRWRRLIDSTDPSWITEYDPPTVQSALAEFQRLSRDRSSIEERLAMLREAVDLGRTLSRLMTATDSAGLLESVVGALVSLGGHDLGQTAPFSRLVQDPSGHKIAVWAVASPGQPSKAAFGVIKALLSEATEHKLLVVNVDANIKPS